MPLPWHPQPKEVYYQWISDIETEASDQLTDWEIDFLESIKRRLNKNWDLTEGQANTLESIYVEKTK